MNSGSQVETYANQPSITLKLTPEPGNFDGPIRVSIQSNSSGATKIFYARKLQAFPHETLRVTDSIELKDSRPLVFFAFNENGEFSPIEVAQYTISYSNALKLENSGNTLLVKNTGETSVSLESWKVFTQKTSIPLPPQKLAPGASFSVGNAFLNGENIFLQNPAGEESGLLMWKEEIIAPKQAIASAQSAPVRLQKKPTTQLEIQEVKPVVLQTEEPKTQTGIQEEAISITPPQMQIQQQGTIFEQAKGSTTESHASGSVMVVGIIVLTIAIVGIVARKFGAKAPL